MKKSELVTVFAEATQMPKVRAEECLERLSDIIMTELIRGGEITLPRIGKLAVVGRKARIGRNPRTGAAIAVPAKKTIKFTTLTALKTSLY